MTRAPKNSLHSSGATEQGVVVFSRIVFGLRDLDSGGVSLHGDDQPTRAFFSFGFALVAGDVAPSSFGGCAASTVASPLSPTTM